MINQAIDFMGLLEENMKAASEKVLTLEELTKEMLEEFGFTYDKGSIFPFYKQIGQDLEEGSDFETPLALAVKSSEDFCLILCDGSTLDLNVSSLEHLKVIELSIAGYEPNH